MFLVYAHVDISVQIAGLDHTLVCSYLFLCYISDLLQNYWEGMMQVLPILE